MGNPASINEALQLGRHTNREEQPGMNKKETTKDLTRTTAPPLLLSIPDVAATLGLGRTKVYELIAKEGLPVVRFGRSVRVSATSLQKWVEQREQQPLSQ